MPRASRRRAGLPSLLLATALACIAAGCRPAGSAGSAPQPPATRRDTATFTVHGQRFSDPYLWLADGSAPEVKTWIAAESAYAERVVGETPLRDSLRAELRRLEDVPQIGSPRRAGKWEYFSLRRPGDPVAGIFRRPAPPADSIVPVDPDGKYEEVVDPLAIDSTGWTRVELRDVSHDGRLVLYDLRDGGADETALRVRDVGRGTDLPDRFPPALYDEASFAPDGRAITYVLRSRETGSRLYRHRLGTDPAGDSVVYDPHAGPDRFVGVRTLEDGRRLVTEAVGWLRDEAWIEDADGSHRVSVTGGLPMHARIRAARRQAVDPHRLAGAPLPAGGGRSLPARPGRLEGDPAPDRRRAHRLRLHREEDLRHLPARRVGPDPDLRTGWDAGGRSAAAAAVQRQHPAGPGREGVPVRALVHEPRRHLRPRPEDRRAHGVRALARALRLGGDRGRAGVVPRRRTARGCRCSWCTGGTSRPGSPCPPCSPATAASTWPSPRTSAPRRPCGPSGAGSGPWPTCGVGASSGRRGTRGAC